MITIFLLTFTTLFPLINPYKIDLNSWKSAQNFDGFGAVSGGGATSKLFFTYFPEEEQRKEVLEALFNKNNGLQLLKVEMGGDDQSTEGTESSHESQPGNFSKNNYEFKLIHEVLRINPAIPICVLPWTFPGWLGKTPYDDINGTALYVVDWIRIGKETWGFDTYCVGVWNERNFSESYVRELRRALDSCGFNKTLIVAGEGFQMDDNYGRLLNKDFINDYDIIGVHYPGGQIPQNVQKSGKTIWASEDYSTDNRKTGMGCMARTMNWNFVDGNITGMLSWHLMSAFYPQLPWWRCGLSRVDEKDGFQTENAFHVIKYILGHVKRGWKILREGSGRFDGGGTYVTYTDGNDFTIFVETMTYQNSLCEYSSPLPYTIQNLQNITFDFTNFSNLAPPTVPFPRGLSISLNFAHPQSIPMRSHNSLQLLIAKDSFGILTTLPITVPQKATVLPPSLPLNYFDDFSNNYLYDDEPRFWIPQKGSWVVRDGRAVQKVTVPPISWCTPNIRTPYAVMSYPNKKSSIHADVMLPNGSDASSVILGLRSNCSGCDIETTDCRGIFVEIFIPSGTVKVFSDFVQRKPITESSETWWPIKYGNFHRVSMKLKESRLFVKFGSQLVASVEIPEDVLEKTKNDSLFVIGTGNFGISEWDNISISF